MSAKVFYEDQKVSGSYAVLHHNRDYQYTTGAVYTAQGIVGVYRQAGLTQLRFVYRGRCHTERHGRSLSDRGLVTVAGRFARSLAGSR